MSTSVEAVMDDGVADAEAIERLAALPPLVADRQMEAAAKERGCTLATLRREVAKRRTEQLEASGTGSGSPLDLPDPEPAPDPVDGAALLDELASTLARFVVMPPEAADATALWTCFTYVINACTFSPRLLIRSPEKRCGKTTLLDAMTEVCRKPLPASNITAAALFRTVEKVAPTVLLDEADTFVRENEELRGLVNSGHRRSLAYVIRTVEIGGNFEPRRFSTWCPMAIAGIGTLHGTIEDRSIVVELRRKMVGDIVERLDEPARVRLRGLARRLRRWADDHLGDLVDIHPVTPPRLHDRASDNWRPLLAIADAISGMWPERARRAATALSGGTDAEGVRELLLRDVRAAFQGRGSADWIATPELINELVEMSERPWAEHSRGRPLTPQGLSALLGPFKIYSSRRRDGGDKQRGFARDAFADAWTRYLPPEPERQDEPAHRPKASNGASFSPVANRPTQDELGRFSFSEESSIHAAPGRWAGSHGRGRAATPAPLVVREGEL